MHPLVAGLLFGLEKNHAWALSLVADLDDGQMVLEPPGSRPRPMNHAAWVLCHLKTYRPIVAQLIRGASFPDPLDHPFGMKSFPQPDRSLYPPKDAILGELETGRGLVESALRDSTDATWAAPVTLVRWQSRWTSVGMGVPFLLLNHENMHLGQLSAWRRALGLPMVPT